MSTPTTYRPLRVPRHENRRIRGLDTHLTLWGPPPTAATPPVFLLHGWQDSAATFQFMVDAFAEDRPLVALDWRGFGYSEWPQQGYWFADYLADLDALIDQFSPSDPVRLVGHSMGGNIATLYAGIRPERVRCVANLEGFGMPRSSAAGAPAQLRKWLAQVKAAPMSKHYDSFEQLTSVVAFRYPRFSGAQAAFVARSWGKLEADGRVYLLGDPRHRWVMPTLYKREDAEAIWREVTAPMLVLWGDSSDYLPRLGEDGTETALRALFADIDIVQVAGAGHMLHIEQATVVAALVGNFLSTH